MASFLYTWLTEKLLTDGIGSLSGATVKVMLVDDTYVPDQDAHEYIDDITGEISGTGYTAGGATIGSKTVTKDDSNNRSVFDAADASWPNSTLTARRGIMYVDTGNPATSPVLACIDFGSNQSTSLSTFAIPWSADGIIRLAIT